MKFSLVLLSFFFSPLSAGVVPSPGKFSFQSSNLKNQNAEGRIINGEVATPGQFPYQVLLEFGTSLCGGSLISDRYILTAAHCTQNVNFGYATLGAHNRNAILELTRQTFAIIKSDIINHEHFNPDTLANDIALIKLRRPALLNAFVQPISLPENEMMIENKNLVVIGWGRTQDGGIASPLLQVTYPFLEDKLVCASHFPVGMVTETNICTSKSVCKGDSGGPLAYHDPDTNRFTLVGAVSFGMPSCAVNSPDVYTNVGSFVPWIKNLMK